VSYLSRIESRAGRDADVSLADRPARTFQGSPDLKAAREVADYLGTTHHEFHFTVQASKSFARALAFGEIVT
jgi:asparagine synthetase B (glutamine-hydrolysing)